MLKLAVANPTDKNIKKTTNFIEKNKGLVSKKLHKTITQNQGEEELTIRCLNDIENNPELSKLSINSNKLSLESSQQIDFDISIISSHSSLLSDANPKKLPEVKSATTNSSLFKFDSGLTKSNFDELDDLNTTNDDDYVQNVISVEHDANSTVKSVQQDMTEMSDGKFESFDAVLAQGQCSSTSWNMSGEEAIQDNQSVNIVTVGDDMAKVRAQFIQRSCSNIHEKRSVVPNIVESLPPNESSSEEQQFYIERHDIVNEMHGQFACNEPPPLASIQNELEIKINNVISELDHLRRKDELLSGQLIEKSLRRSVEKNEESKRRQNENLIRDEQTRSRINYLENLQEKQLEMMTQLISVIGKENSHANSTASSARESLHTFRQQLDNSPSNSFTNVPPPPRPAKTQQKSHVSLKSKAPILKKTKSSKPSRSRSRNKSSNGNRSKSRSTSRGRRQFSADSSDHGCSTCDRKRSNFTSVEAKKKSKDFLDELLGEQSMQQKSPERPVRKFLESKSVSSFENNIYDNQPTLFDKYLHEAKNANKLYEQRIEKELANAIEKNASEAELGVTIEKVPGVSKKPLEEKKSMFTDIKEVLRAVEFSKAQLEGSLAESARPRNSRAFNQMNNHIGQSERIRMKKLVDGCVSAISNDVQKEVSQRLIDESKHAKLEAGKDAQPHSYVRKRALTAAKTRDTLKSKSNVGFGSSAARPISSNDKKKKEQSDTSKYIGKVFGKNLLDQIKLDDLEERNQKMKQQLEEQKELKRQLDIQKQQQNLNTQHQSRLFKNISNKGQLKKEPESTKSVSQQRGLSTESKPKKYVPKLVLDSLKPTFKSSQVKGDSSARPSTDRGNNVALVTITPRETSPPPKVKKELKRQNLPSLSINPTAKVVVITEQEKSESSSIKSDKITPRSEPKEPQSKSTNSARSSIDLDQSGAGIQMTGFRKQDEPVYDGNKFPPNTKPTGATDIHTLNKLSSETEVFLRERNMLEKDAYDWIEQQLISRFIINLANEEQNNPTLQQSDEESISSESMNLHEIPDNPFKTNNLNILGADGLRLIMDMGSDINPDFMEALIQECLEEKINNEINNEQLKKQQKLKKQSQIKETTPIASPRKRSLDRNNIQSISLDENYSNVQTPATTPEQPKPFLDYSSIGTQVAFAEKSPVVEPARPTVVQVVPTAPVVPTPAVPTPAKPVEPIIKYVRYIPEEEESSILEVTITEKGDNQDSYEEHPSNIYVPNTPNETPVQTPSPEDLGIETPSFSDHTPIPKNITPKPSSPLQPHVITRTTSVQCDPVPESVPVAPSAPIVRQILQPFEPKRNLEKQDEVDESTTESMTTGDLTVSTQYTSEVTTSTTQNTTRSEENESYFSDGAWLLSKSEGQIIETFPNKVYRQGPNEMHRKQSVGEVKLASLAEKKSLKANSVNFTRQGSEMGEVIPTVVANQVPETNSEGEIVKSVTEQVETSLKSEKVKKPKSSGSKKSKTKPKEDKKCINISIGPEKSTRNNIQIKSIPNEICIRDSVDMERKIYSSTPDQSMLIVQPLATFLDDDEDDFSHYTKYEDEDDKEVTLESLRVENPKKKPSKSRILVASSDLNTERDEESLATLSGV